MKNHFIVLAIIFISFSVSNAQRELWYISPGLTISYDFKHNFLISPKVSLGILSRNEYANITIGSVSILKNNQYSYVYIEPQFGSLLINTDNCSIPIMFGFGLGIAILNEEGEKTYALKGSVCAGYFLFLNSSFLFGEKNHSDLGLQVVFPIPFEELDLH